MRSDIPILGYDTAAQIAFKNCAPFTTCIPEIDGITIEYAEDLDLFRLMCNLLEYSSIYSNATGTLLFYEATNFNDDITNTDDLKSFNYDAKLLKNTEADGVSGILRNTKMTVPLKHLSKFWRSLDSH